MKLYQVDAFTDKVFSGNPAAVVPLARWADERWMQQVAMENNLAETAFFVKNEHGYEIRWFTPTVEVDLCGHATLAAAHVIFSHQQYAGSEIHFHSSRSGMLKVFKHNEFLTLDFPTDHIQQISVTPELIKCFNTKPKEAYKGKTDFMFVFANERQVQELQPDMQLISKLACRGVIVTATGNTVDFVSRFFAPQSGIPEDPVTGSAHTTLTPYWANQYSKTELTAMQLSVRKGYLKCKHLGERVHISGQARTYLVGDIVV